MRINRRIRPLRFEKIRLVREFETSVDLLAYQTKGCARRQAISVKKFFQKLLKSKPTRLGFMAVTRTNRAARLLATSPSICFDFDGFGRSGVVGLPPSRVKISSKPV